MPKKALFINGVYDSVLVDIMQAQKNSGGGCYFLQPYKGQVIALLREKQPSSENPIRLYLSTTSNLNTLCYTALIVGWEDKRKLTPDRRAEVEGHLKKHQHGEVDLFTKVEDVGETAVNLITVTELRQMDSQPMTSLLVKESDGLPLKRRSRPGGWSVVSDLGDLSHVSVETQSHYDADLDQAVKKASEFTDEQIQKIINATPKKPEKVQLISTGFKRNSAVIEAVLRRADGVCEECKKDAPFKRRTNGSPYLEVHHILPLSEDGTDHPDNATALCPNCHAEAHYG